MIAIIKKRFHDKTPLFPGDCEIEKRTKKIFTVLSYKWLMSPCLEIVHQILLADLVTSKLLTKKATAETRTFLRRSFRIKHFSFHEENKDQSLLRFFLAPKFLLFNDEMQIGFRTKLDIRIFSRHSKNFSSNSKLLETDCDTFC